MTGGQKFGNLEEPTYAIPVVTSYKEVHIRNGYIFAGLSGTEGILSGNPTIAKVTHDLAVLS